jgi:hypothetical protein
MASLAFVPPEFNNTATRNLFARPFPSGRISTGNLSVLLCEIFGDAVPPFQDESLKASPTFPILRNAFGTRKARMGATLVVPIPGYPILKHILRKCAAVSRKRYAQTDS